MSKITTHVLYVAAGTPAAGVPVTLERRDGAAAAAATGGWRLVGSGRTDADGRLKDLLPEGEPLAAGDWRLRFDTGAWFAASGVTGFYPEVSVTFTVRETGRHHHVPLLLSPFGYSTYRGS